MCRWLAFVFLQINFVFSLPKSEHRSNFSQWSEDDLVETRLYINKKFTFDNQPYENIILRTRLNEWSFELSNGNGSHSSQIWTEFHLYLAHHQSKSYFNNSIPDHMINHCYPPIISSLTNDSTVRIQELYDIDQRIGNYFRNNHFFRTINYIQCSIIEERQNPFLRVHINIYFVTNREFQSLFFIEMLNTTKFFLENHQAKFFLHNFQRKFHSNYDISNINSTDNSGSSMIWMVKLYNETKPRRNKSMILQINFIIFLISLFKSFTE